MAFWRLGNAQNGIKGFGTNTTVGATFTRATIDVTGRPPWRRGNGSTPIGFLGRLSLRRERCGMGSMNQNLRAIGKSGGVH
jgi:hypothetical protein